MDDLPQITLYIGDDNDEHHNNVRQTTNKFVPSKKITNRRNRTTCNINRNKKNACKT